MGNFLRSDSNSNAVEDVPNIIDVLKKNMPVAQVQAMNAGISMLNVWTPNQIGNFRLTQAVLMNFNERNWQNKGQLINTRYGQQIQGGKSSTQPIPPSPSQSPPPSPPLLSVPWRNAPALDEQHLLELKAKVENFSLPANLNVTRAKILMLGPAKAGKSSFVKTITSIFQERIAQPTTTGTATESLTMKYRQFLVRSLNNERPLNFCLCDTCGFDPSGAPDLADLNYLLEGNVPDGYIFGTTPVHPDVTGFIHQPGIQNKVHCVVFIFEASLLKITDEDIWEKLNALQLRMNIKDIPRIVLLTKIDKLSEAVKNDVSQVFLSRDVQRAVDYVSHRLGIPPGNVMPVINYENESMLDNTISCLALQALDRILGYATDYLMYQNDHM